MKRGERERESSLASSGVFEYEAGLRIGSQAFGSEKEDVWSWFASLQVWIASFDDLLEQVEPVLVVLCLHFERFLVRAVIVV